MAAGMPALGLRGALSAVPGPRSDRCCCIAIAVWPTCRSRWDAAMGPSLGGPLHDPYGGQDAESQSQGTVFGGAVPIAKPVKIKWRKGLNSGGAYAAPRDCSTEFVGRASFDATCLSQLGW